MKEEDNLATDVRKRERCAERAHSKYSFLLSPTLSSIRWRRGSRFGCDSPVLRWSRHCGLIGLVLPLLLVCLASSRAERVALPLGGAWRFAMDEPKPGATQEALPAIQFKDTIQLPGTTDTNRKGPENQERWKDGLTRVHKFVGPAWYERDFTIPASWRRKRIILFLERTKYTQVWIDGRACGTNAILCTPQEYALGPLEPGNHRLTILIDNSRRPVNAEMHQMSENTQGNWNGVIGKMELLGTDPVWLEELQIYPEIVKKLIRVKVRLGNVSGLGGRGVLTLRVQGKGSAAKPVTFPVSWSISEGSAELELPLGNEVQSWDEFHPILCTLTATLSTDLGTDERVVPFGLREFAAKETQFAVNGRPTFLRGKHDGCVFPLTGHPPMEVEGWLKYLRICQEYGINHIRFHTWTPPEAAFTAADRLGIYLQPELPFWGSYTEKERDALMPEAARILSVYGNHPSFVMFSLGNECGGSREIMRGMIRDLRARDSRHLYTQGSNNYYWAPESAEGDDYWTIVRTSTDAAQNVRGSFATVDGGNGHVQIGPPGTTYDYSAGLLGVRMPVIGHEIGQYTVYPNFREIPKYTGVFRARNFELFRDKLAAAQMLDQADDFFRASGKLAALCYREEIETALHTPGMGGFQLLDLQDFPGQGTALVGILDAFMESKGAIRAEEWRRFCGPVSLLARFERYNWTPAETFTADIQVAHYGERDLTSSVLEWNLKDSKGHRITRGKLPPLDVKQGGLRALGRLTIPLAAVKAPAELSLELQLKGTSAVNAYPLWVFPEPARMDSPPGVKVVRALDPTAREALAKGERVVLIPEAGRLANTVEGGFATDFWCWPMFHNRPGTMGLLCDPKHPALKRFPTGDHTDWHWFNLLTSSQPIVLDELPGSLRPIVQIIDNLDRNHKLGLVFETRVGPGRLLVCATDLIGLSGKPEAGQLLKSLLDYAHSEAFKPAQEMSIPALRKLLTRSLPIQVASASSSQGKDNTAAKAIDGDARTRWCAADNSNGQWLLLDLGARRSVSGCALRWEYDKPGYAYVLEGSDDGSRWTTLSDQSQNHLTDRHRLDFPTAEIRFVRVKVLSQPTGAWASIRECEVFGEE